MKARIRARAIVDYKAYDHFYEVYYAFKRKINSMWYLYNQSGYVISAYSEEDIEFIK